MKKSLVITLVLAMLLSLGWGGFKAVDTAAEPGDTVVSFSDILDISEAGAGVENGQWSHYFEYRTNIVHTSHGDYAVYFTNTVGESKKMNQFSVIKIKDGVSEVVLQDWMTSGSSQVSLHVDADENVWAMVAEDQGLKDQFDGRTSALAVAAYRIDAETDKAIGYTAILPQTTTGGFGYAVSVMDVAQNKIYAVAPDGSSTSCALYWAIFDMETCTWEPVVRSIPLDSRHCYHYIYADGNGGMIILDERDSMVTSSITPYPEIGNNIGLTEEDLATFSRWSANYVWDQLDAYYIPDVYDTDFEVVSVAPADYSRVIGDQDYRYSLEGRKNNEYPNITNNAGDTFIDADGNFHVVYMKSFSKAAYDRQTTETQWWHVVYDISDPENMTKLSETFIIEEVADGTENAYRLYEDSKDNLYLIRGCKDRASYNSQVIVYAINGSADEGYEYEELASKDYVGEKAICISNTRSNSTEDDTLALIYRDTNGSNGDGDYNYMQISFGEEPAPTTLNIEGVKVEMKDQNGKVLPIGEGEIEIIAVDRDGVPTKGKVAEDGTVTFDPFAIPEAGEYYYYISMTEGEDEKIAYSKDVFCIAVEAKAVDGELKTELKGIMNGNYEAESVIFKVVKTVEEPGTGDTTQIWLWVALVAVAALAAGAAIVLRRKAVQK